MIVTGPHVWFEPGDTVGPVDLYQIEGPQSAVPFPTSSAHVVLNICDSHPDLLVSLVLASREAHLV